MTLEELNDRLSNFREYWCRSQKTERDLEMFSHMCYVVGVEPSFILTAASPDVSEVKK